MSSSIILDLLDLLDIFLVNNLVFTTIPIASFENTDCYISLQPRFHCRRRKKHGLGGWGAVAHHIDRKWQGKRHDTQNVNVNIVYVILLMFSASRVVNLYRDRKNVNTLRARYEMREVEIF